MLFDRITLTKIYDTLKTVDSNDDRVSSILIHRISKYGTKTLPRFENVEQLRIFINDNFPYINQGEDYCGCLTCREGFFELLNFKVKDFEDTSMFVNNLRRDFESGKASRLNGLSVKALQKLFSESSYIKSLFDGYVCFPYIEDPGEYTDPCEYIEIIRNIQYNNALKLYYETKRSDIPKLTKKACS